jgi:hypothetical protein
MAVINYFKKEIHVKIVYCGPGLSGKTTNLQWLNQNLSQGKVGKLISLATKTDRTLFFDLMAVNFGKIRGFDTRIQLFTTPGQVYYNATRKLVLKGVDGVVFVADSQEPMRAANLESLDNLRENLAEYELALENLPLVYQYNKRDLSGVTPIETLEADLNPRHLPYFEASAVTGEGVEETFAAITRLSLEALREIHEKPAAAPEPPTPVAVAQAPIAMAPKALKDLKVKQCLEATVSADGLVKLPLVLVQPASGEEFRVVLELRLK